MGKTEVLYIEDDQAQRKDLSGRLRSRGYSVTVAASGETGLQMFRERSFDVILCDLNMPGMSGLDVLDKVREKNKVVPFAVLSAHGTVPQAMAAVGKGADHFILKPIEVSQIEVTIEQMIERIRLEKKLRFSDDDITEMKKVMEALEESNRNLKETQAQLVQSEKMASIGSLVAGIAHEINTPIGAVSSMYDTLCRTLGKLKDLVEVEFTQAQKEKLESAFSIIDDADTVIRSGTERVVNIVKKLKSFARLDETELRSMDIHEGLEDTLTLIHHEIKHFVTVNKDYGHVPPLSCFPGQLNQVFLNLLINSKQSIQGKGTIGIKTYAKDDKVYIEISDDGSGIPKSNLRKVFDPGFTTKGRGVGAGLGLSICHQIIQAHQGEIRVESELGQGTTFTIILPRNLENLLEAGKKHDQTG